MKIKEYLEKKDQYSVMPKELDSIGNVVDTELQNELTIGIHIHRDVYSKIAYVLNENAPELLHACVCALLDHVFEMPIIKTVLLKPDVIVNAICEEGEVTKEVVRYSNMALCALNEAFKGYLAERSK